MACTQHWYIGGRPLQSEGSIKDERLEQGSTTLYYLNSEAEYLYDVLLVHCVVSSHFVCTYNVENVREIILIRHLIQLYSYHHSNCMCWTRSVLKNNLALQTFKWEVSWWFPRISECRGLVISGKDVGRIFKLLIKTLY